MTPPALQWVRRLRRLSWSEFRLIAEAQFTLLYFQLARWVTPTGRLIGIQPDDVVTCPEDSELQVADAVGWAVTRAARYGIFRPQCLVRSLALQGMLVRRRIHSSTLRIGVRRENGAISAHAWVEVGDRVVGDSLPHVRTFTPTTTLRLEGL